METHSKLKWYSYFKVGFVHFNDFYTSSHIIDECSSFIYFLNCCDFSLQKSSFPRRVECSHACPHSPNRLQVCITLWFNAPSASPTGSLSPLVFAFASLLSALSLSHLFAFIRTIRRSLLSFSFPSIILWLVLVSTAVRSAHLCTTLRLHPPFPLLRPRPLPLCAHFSSSRTACS